MSDWRRDAACRGANVNLFVPVGMTWTEQAAEAAKRVCRGCPVVDECLRAAAAELDDVAVRGGTLPEERADLIRAARDARRTRRRVELSPTAWAALRSANQRGELPPGVATEAKRALLRAGLASEGTPSIGRGGGAVRLNRAGRELAARAETESAEWRDRQDTGLTRARSGHDTDLAGLMTQESGASR